MVKFPKHFSKIRMILFSVSFLAFTVCVQSELKSNIEYFVMIEAHMSEYRANETVKSGYAPFYIECHSPPKKHTCEPAIPKTNVRDGYVRFQRSGNNKLYYGCPLKINLENVLNPQEHFQKALLMKLAKSTPYQMTEDSSFYNVYDYRCVSEVLPVLWAIGPLLGVRVSYGIGYLIYGVKNMLIAEVYYDYGQKIPIWTKHTLYGASLAAPIAAFESIEEIVYQDDPGDNQIPHLKNIIQSYYDFNKRNNTRNIKKEIQDVSLWNSLKKIPDTNKIVVGHMIPEYDMITSTWQKVSRFAQTVVPTWEELYLNEWIDVEEMIREESFWEDRKLTVYSGTHGQLTFETPADKPELKPKFFLDETFRVVVPEIIWKLVIDEISDQKKATVVIFRNLTKALEDLKIFTEFTPPCNQICTRFRPTSPDEPKKLIYCCMVNEVKEKIKLPIDVRRNFNKLIE